MITPIEIQSKTFKSGGLGYDKRDVDGFLREVLASYETVYRENLEMKDRLTTLNDGLNYYKTIEKTIQKALVLAEKTAEDTKVAAMEKASVIEKEAQTHAQLIIADAKNELEHIHQQTIQLIQQYEKYKMQFKNLAAAQMELIESDCFNINIARLDAFIDNDLEAQNSKKNAVKKDSVKETPKYGQPSEDDSNLLHDSAELAMQEASVTLEDKKNIETQDSDTTKEQNMIKENDQFSFIDLIDHED